MAPYIHISAIEVENFKNIRYGKIVFPNARKPEEATNKNVLGLYGQNGSGKTAIVQAFKLIQELIEGGALPEDANSFVFDGEKIAVLKLSFSIIIEDVLMCKGCYEIMLEREESGVYLTKESISYRLEKKGQKTKEISCSFASESLFLEKLGFVKSKPISEDDRIELLVQRKRSKEEKKSLLFSDKLREVLEHYDRKDAQSIIYILVEKFHTYVVIISSKEIGYIYSNIFLPVNVHLSNESKPGGVVGHYGIGMSKEDRQDLNEPLIISKEAFMVMNKIFEQINLILPALIPELTISLNNLGNQTLKDGSLGIRVEFLAHRGDRELPLYYESDGVKKIISILSVLVALFNNQNMFVVIDELDAGIYEFLLGELIDVLNKNGKGQLLFTSHNLRLLEVLERENLMFTTTNECNRFIPFKGVKQTNNIRDLYLRAIQIGGQNEEVYAETDTFEIRRAFEKAGKVNYESD